MVEYCLINFLGITAWCIPDYVIYGIILFIVGLLIATFLPFETGKKVGLGMVILGIIMAIFFPLVADWWANNLVLRILVYGTIFLIVILMILFPSKKEK